jgi:hypothetical protein
VSARGLVVFACVCAGCGDDTAAPPADLATADAGVPDLATGGDLAIVDTCPLALASQQSVTIDVNNVSSGDRWLITQGQYCLPLDVGGLPLKLGYRALCGSPPPPPVFALYYTRVAPGATVTLGWDGLALITCSRPIDCEARGVPDGGVQRALDGVYQPVAGGNYVATVAYESSPPPCAQQPNGDYLCAAPDGGTLSPPTQQPLCSATATATGTLTLPATGTAKTAIDIN